jgi:hypothetical protein
VIVTSPVSRFCSWSAFCRHIMLSEEPVNLSNGAWFIDDDDHCKTYGFTGSRLGQATSALVGSSDTFAAQNVRRHWRCSFHIGLLLVFGAHLPASMAGGAGARPDHPPLSLTIGNSDSTLPKAL